VWLRTVEPDRLNSVLRFKCLNLFLNNLRANHTKSTLKWSSFFCCLSLSTRNLNNNPLLRAVSKTLNAFIFCVLCSAPTSSDKGYLRYHSSCLFVNLFSYSHWYQNRIRLSFSSFYKVDETRCIFEIRFLSLIRFWECFSDILLLVLSLKVFTFVVSFCGSFRFFTRLGSVQFHWTAGVGTEMLVCLANIFIRFMVEIETSMPSQTSGHE